MIPAWQRLHVCDATLGEILRVDHRMGSHPRILVSASTVAVGCRAVSRAQRLVWHATAAHAATGRRSRLPTAAR